MSTSQADIVKVVKTDTELWADERIGWWIKLARNTVWLKAEDTSCHVVNVITPTSNNRIPFD